METNGSIKKKGDRKLDSNCHSSLICISNFLWIGSWLGWASYVASTLATCHINAINTKKILCLLHPRHYPPNLFFYLFIIIILFPSNIWNHTSYILPNKWASKFEFISSISIYTNLQSRKEFVKHEGSTENNFKICLDF